MSGALAGVAALVHCAALPRAALARAALLATLLPAAPLLAADQNSTPHTKLSDTEIKRLLQVLPAVALVNDQDQPYFTAREGSTQVGFFYLDPKEALSEYKILQQKDPSEQSKLKLIPVSDLYFSYIVGEQFDLGGKLRLRPSRRQIVYANRALQFNSPPGALLPTTLSEQKGEQDIATPLPIYGEKFNKYTHTHTCIYTRRTSADILF